MKYNIYDQSGEHIGTCCVQGMEQAQDFAQGLSFVPVGEGYTLASVALPPVGAVIRCKAPAVGGGFIDWRGTVTESGRMVKDGSMSGEFVITQDTLWILDTQAQQSELLGQVMGFNESLQALDDCLAACGIGGL